MESPCVDFFADRICRLDERFNLVAVRLFDQARARAADADAAAAEGRFWGPLHGVPMTVKEAFALDGTPSTVGWERLRDYKPEKDAAALRRLLDAGAIIIAKTNVPKLCNDLQSYNSIYGTSNNPWDLSRSPGGSSGGAAGALAAGLTPLELGSDIGGSIRGPAHCCGVVGHKPSLGIIDTSGHVPPAPFSSVPSNLYVVGPMARTCSDLALALGILVGTPDRLKDGWEIKLPQPRAREVWRLRIAVCADHDFCRVDADVARCVESAGRALAGAGAFVDFCAVPDFDFGEASSVFATLLKAEVDGPGGTLPHGEYWSNEDSRLRIKDKWAEFFQHFDAFLCPAARTPAIKHDHSTPMASRSITVNGDRVRYLSWILWAGLVGLADLPATVVPAGLSSDGLPIGVQVVAPMFHDYTSIQVGSLLEQYHCSFVPPPIEQSRL